MTPDDVPPADRPLNDLIEDAFPGKLGQFFRPADSPPRKLTPGLEAGRVVGDFELLSMIGQGGMGQVWEARQTSMGGRHIAVKFVRPERVTVKQLAYFEREARAGGRLSHPGIVTMFGYGRTDGLAWITMELVPGAWTLRDFLDELARKAEVPADYDRHVARFVREVALAMHAAHRAGVIHRDLKPQNVLITADNRPKVTDFGLARITEEAALSATGDMAGTYFYMSPEQVAAKRMGIDHRTDIFSLGVLMYETLTLVRPFQGDTSHQVAQQIVTKEPPDPRLIRSRIPRDLAVIVGKALEKDRDKRYATMDEMARDLQRFLCHEPIQAKPPTRLDRFVKLCRRHPARSLAGAVAASAFVVITGLSLGLMKSNDALASSVSALKSKTSEAERSRERANELAVAERKRADEVLRLSLGQDLEDLVLEADQLWPPHPERLAELRDWQRRAEALIAQRSDLEATRDELEATSAGASDPSRERWWREQLSGLIGAMNTLTDPRTGLLAGAGISAEDGWSIPRRIDSALELRQAFADGGAFATRWDASLEEIRRAADVSDLAPQMGLVPIGTDPQSGLWEFWHVPSGDEPVRGEDGRLQLTESSGLVFVLIPADEFAMGASSHPESVPYDKFALDREGPVHTVRLSSYFLSKFELTQAQWLRMTGSDPSLRTPDTHELILNRMHPVERVSWAECDRQLRRMGLTLPSEAQWEYACRAKSTTVWPFPFQDFELYANTREADYRAAFSDKEDCMDWSDGFAAHGPVGCLLPNAFGLHDMIGNVWEWCLDGFDEHAYATDSVLDPVHVCTDRDQYVERGGGYFDNAVVTRSAGRGSLPAAYSDEGLGLRPARHVLR